MFKFETNKVKEFKRIISAVSALVDDGVVEINKEGLHIKALDPSQIVMIVVNIPSAMFDKYELDNNMNAGINFLEFSKILKRAKDNEDILNVQIDSKVKVKFIGKTSREFEFGLIEAPSVPSREPKIEQTATIKLAGKLIKDFIGDIESISTKISLNISKDKFIITSSSDENTTSGKIEISDENLIGKEVKEDAKATFSIEYLKNLMAGIDVDTVVSLGIKTDSPLVMEYNVDNANIRSYLAPRIDM